MAYSYIVKTDKGSEISGFSNFKSAKAEAMRNAIKFRESVSIYRNGVYFYRVEFPFYLRNLSPLYKDLVCYSVL